MELDAWSVVVAAVAVGIAVWGVIVAHRANGRSMEANEIARKSLEAQQRSLPPEWSSNESGKWASSSYRNQSSRVIIVERLSTLPEAQNVYIEDDADLPRRVEFGDVLPVDISVEGFPDPTHVVIEWRFEDEDAIHVTERRL
jgi:hypothetical protein